MTKDQLDLILAKTPADIVKDLSKSSYNLPEWDDLIKQYDPNEHAIKKDLQKYPIISNENGFDDMKRITYSYQKLAVSKISQNTFASPVVRMYAYDKDDEKQQLAVDVIEEIYRWNNDIDAENIERAKKNNATCQVATIWNTKPQENIVKGIKASLKLIHSTYSEKEGYKLFPIIDQYGDLLVLSVSYKDSEDKENFDIYSNGNVIQAIHYKKLEDWVLSPDYETNPEKLEIFPVSYTNIPEPVWGGDSGTSKIELIEETVSFRAMYIKKNAVPLAYIDKGDTAGMTESKSKESDQDKRRLQAVGKGGKVAYVVWDLNNGIVDSQIKEMKDAFWAEIQVADNSFSTLISSNTSAENKELIFADSKSKAIDLGGEWVMMFNRELNDIILPIAKVLFPSLSTQIEAITVRSVIIPYNVRTDKDKAEILANAGASMSLESKIKYLGIAPNVQTEIDAINEESAKLANEL